MPLISKASRLTNAGEPLEDSRTGSSLHSSLPHLLVALADCIQGQLTGIWKGFVFEGRVLAEHHFWNNLTSLADNHRILLDIQFSHAIAVM